ncbi:PPE family protein [Mycobacterium sp. SVM_VP21]|nr:PPE family protein [Mycobacterium sp. SVM_VP21]
MDFGALPPELNSARMYSGPGAGPMLAAAAAWDAVSAELSSTASAYDSEVSGLANEWAGSSSNAMVAAAAPYVMWMSRTAGHAARTAAGARAAATAYEAAFAATVPPAVIAANRSLLATLIATNILGQNTIAIAATEAHYAEMWAQDAAAMYGYAGAAAAAARVAPFGEPPQTTNPAGATTQVASVFQATATSATSHSQVLPQLLTALPESLNGLAAPVSAAASPAAAGDLGALLTALNSFIVGPLSPASLFTIAGVPGLLGVQSYLLPQAAANLTSSAEKVSKLPYDVVGEPLAGALGMKPPTLTSTALPGVAAQTAGAGRLAGMSVPSGWFSAAPEIKTVAAMLPESNFATAPTALAAESDSAMLNNIAVSGLVGRGMVGTGESASRQMTAASPPSTKEFAPATDFVTSVNIFVLREGD